MYKLTKLSSPSWTRDVKDIDTLFTLVDSCVCDQCKINTYEGMKKSFEDNEHIDSFTDEDILMELEYCCVDEDYGDMSIEDKVDELLHTACGCEYMLEVE